MSTGQQLQKIDGRDANQDMQELTSSFNKLQVDAIAPQHPYDGLTKNPQAMSYIGQFQEEKIKKDANPFGIANTVLFLKDQSSVKPIMRLSKRDQLDHLLGATSKVKVIRAYDVTTGEEIALKKAYHFGTLDAAKQREQAREKSTLIMLNRFRGELQRQKDSCVVDYTAQELVKGDNVADFLKKKNDILMVEKDKDEIKKHLEELLQVAYLFCQTVSEFNQLGMIHRDIKPENMMVNKVGDRFELKLIDFGGAIPAKEAATDPDKDYGTQGYMAPEIAQGEFSFATDAYAVGESLNKFLALMNAGCFRITLAKNRELKAFKESLEGVSKMLTAPDAALRMNLQQAQEALSPLAKLLPKTPLRASKH